MSRGRPTEYKPEFCDRVIELGGEGKSPAQIASHLGVARPTLYLWAETYPDFLTALTRAKTEEQRWWEDQAQMGLTAERFNAAVWTKSAQARFREDYTERRELTGANGGAIKTEETGQGAAKLAAFLENIAERSGTAGEPDA